MENFFYYKLETRTSKHDSTYVSEYFKTKEGVYIDLKKMLTEDFKKVNQILVCHLHECKENMVVRHWLLVGEKKKVQKLSQINSDDTDDEIHTFHYVLDSVTVEDPCRFCSENFKSRQELNISLKAMITEDFKKLNNILVCHLWKYNEFTKQLVDHELIVEEDKEIERLSYLN